NSSQVKGKEVNSPQVKDKEVNSSQVKGKEVNILNQHLLQEIEYLKESKDQQLKAKDEQIKSLVEAQKQTQNLLDQQQRLALQDKKLLDEYKSEINDLKALKMPSHDTKEEQVDNQPQTDLESLKSEITALNDKIKGQEELNNQSSKKWYQFWK
ncbi:DNA-binding protein, partial [Lactococcus cremoris]|uniref:DNA-binding protein n=1 Tax=Lactococcus lactis subsp. cremoris TaxID=1359 RepID=UPI0021AA11AD